MTDGTGSGTTDQDYIRQAVELADGFGYDHDGFHAFMYGTDSGGTKWPMSGQLGLDALAAQLVRQVDASDNHYVASDIFGYAVMMDEDFQTSCTQTGPDRTMNTIKAIVDSEVLK